MNDTAMILEFDSRRDFRAWLDKNHDISDGIWILFTKGCKSFTAHEALEEAICFGWIDGLMKSVDEDTYKKYFSQRKDKSNWSEKNRTLFNKLKEKGIMTEYGVSAFQYRSDDKSIKNKADVHSKNIMTLKTALQNSKDILNAFENIAASRQKQLAGFYCEAKTDETREKRKARIIEAIRTNDKGMLY